MTQGSIPRPRIQKIRGQGQENSWTKDIKRKKKGLRAKKSETFAKFQAFSKKKQRSSQIFCEVSGILQEGEKKVMTSAHF